MAMYTEEINRPKTICYSTTTLFNYLAETYSFDSNMFIFSAKTIYENTI
jgi:hypothetical protein